MPIVETSLLRDGCHYGNLSAMEGSHPLKEWRAREGLRQEDAAERLGISKPTVSRLEKGRRKPSLALAAKLSERTGIPVKLFRPDLVEILEAS